MLHTQKVAAGAIFLLTLEGVPVVAETAERNEFRGNAVSSLEEQSTLMVKTL